MTASTHAKFFDLAYFSIRARSSAGQSSGLMSTIDILLSSFLAVLCGALVFRNLLVVGGVKFDASRRKHKGEDLRVLDCHRIVDAELLEYLRVKFALNAKPALNIVNAWLIRHCSSFLLLGICPTLSQRRVL